MIDERKKKRRLGIIITVISFILSLVLAVFLYISNYYEANMDRIDKYVNANNIEYIIEEDKIIYEVDNPKAGFIFYPGGKVEYLAYIPLMEELALNGIFCILLNPPFNLAVLNTNQANGIVEKYDIDDWYIGGHSLGGTIASIYLRENYDDFKGLVLLGAYSSVDLSNTDLTVLSIYGEFDEILNMKSYNESIVLLPSNYIEYIIPGGCHSYFGMYGLQDGDGKPTITNEEQIKITANYILKMINN